MLMEKYGLPLAQYTENVSYKHIHPNCPLSAKYEPKHSGVQLTHFDSIVSLQSSSAELMRIRIQLFTDEVPDPAFHFSADPDLASQMIRIHADLDP